MPKYPAKVYAAPFFAAAPNLARIAVSNLRASAANLRIPSDNFSIAIASSLSAQRNSDSL